MNPARGVATSGVADTGWYRDRIGNVECAYVHGKMTEASFEHFLAEACRTIDECGEDEQVAMFLEVLEPALMDSRWRKRMVVALKARAAKLSKTRPAYVMVTPSLVVRTALKVVQWAAPPPYPHTVVSSVEEGCAFIARHVPGLDPVALQTEYERLRGLYLATRGRG